MSFTWSYLYINTVLDINQYIWFFLSFLTISVSWNLSPANVNIILIRCLNVKKEKYDVFISCWVESGFLKPLVFYHNYSSVNRFVQGFLSLKHAIEKLFWKKEQKIPNSGGGYAPPWICPPTLYPPLDLFHFYFFSSLLYKICFFFIKEHYIGRFSFRINIRSFIKIKKIFNLNKFKTFF